MSGPPGYHFWTHANKGVGGSDPVPPDLPFVEAFVQSLVVTADTEAPWDSVTTTDPNIFRYDSSDPAGLLFQDDGWYLYQGTLRVPGGSASTLRAMSLQTGRMSGGPFGGSPVADTNNFASGFTEVTAASHAAVPTTLLWQATDRGIFGLSKINPGRAALVIDHQGTNFSCDCYMRVLKLSNFIGGTPPLPEVS